MSKKPIARFITSFLILLSVSASVWCEAEGLFAPYVSNIRAQAQDNGILVTWKNSPDIKGDLFVFRYTKEITNDTFQDAVPVARVASGVNSFTDHPGDSREYYYLVLGSNILGDLYEYFIPFRNASTLAVSVEIESAAVQAPIRITGIKAEINKDSVILRFSASRKNEELIVYRHTDPIGDLESLINATRVSIISSNSNQFVDYPIPGITYYYTVQDAQKIKTGEAEFIFGENSLDKGVRIATATNRTGLPPSTFVHERSRPLPYLLLSTEISTGRSMRDSLSLLSPQQQELSPATQSIVSSIVSGVSEYKSRITKPDILPSETADSPSGEENTLRQIVETRLESGDYANGIEELTGFLSLRRSKEINYRGRYYLGQMFYFSGDYQKAFLEFLIAEEQYYPNAKPWIEDIYYLMRNQSKLE